MSKTADQLTIEALQARLVEQVKRTEQIIHDRNAALDMARGVGGTYIKKNPKLHIESDLLVDTIDRISPYEDVICFNWSKAARMRWLLPPHYQIDGAYFHRLPRKVQAESWWHLCAQVGVIEPVARVIYYHPENGQESAVAKAKPVQRGPIISCQGDYIE
jgi:hypothetical protein